MTDTPPSLPPRLTARPFPLVPAPVRVDIGALTHPGLVRENNEDQFFVARLTRSLETVMASMPAGDVPARADEINYVMVVADGMGGHAAGEVASQLAISTLVQVALDVPDWFFRLDDEYAPEIERRAREAIRAVDAKLLEHARRDPALRGMGSTMTGVRSLGQDLMVAHVGDSRAYVFRAGRLHRLTKDHTYAQLLIDSGQALPGSAEVSRLQHVLTNVLGGADDQLDVDIDLLRLGDGDRLLLCSDGLSDLVDDDAIARTLAATPKSQEACAALVQLALERGGRDNITVIVASYGFPDVLAATLSV